MGKKIKIENDINNLEGCKCCSRMSKEGSSERMDSRCPLQKEDYPTSFCPMAVIKLKAIRAEKQRLGRSLTEEEESRLPGCSYFINSQSNHYCWFYFVRNSLDKPMQPQEIAHMLDITVEDVNRIEKEAFKKVQNHPIFNEIREIYGADRIFDIKEEDVVYSISEIETTTD